MSSEVLGAIGGALLSLVFGFVPGAKGWFEGLSSQYKALFMLALVTVAAGGAFALSCYSPYVSFECSENGFWELAGVWVAAILSNQGVHQLTTRAAPAIIGKSNT